MKIRMTWKATLIRLKHIKPWQILGPNFHEHLWKSTSPTPLRCEICEHWNEESWEHRILGGGMGLNIFFPSHEFMVEKRIESVETCMFRS